MTKRMGAGPP